MSVRCAGPMIRGARRTRTPLDHGPLAGHGKLPLGAAGGPHMAILYHAHLLMRIMRWHTK